MPFRFEYAVGNPPISRSNFPKAVFQLFLHLPFVNRSIWIHQPPNLHLLRPRVKLRQKEVLKDPRVLFVAVCLPVLEIQRYSGLVWIEHLAG